MQQQIECRIEWQGAMAPQDWEERFGRISRSTLLQHYSYARAVCPLYRQQARWALIMIDGQEAGLVQITEARFLFGAFHAVMLDRGPLWFDGYGGFVHVQAFFAAFARMFPARLGRKRRLLPEIEASPMFTQMMQGLGYRKMDIPDYRTLWVDLTLDEATLRSNLKKNWRGTLNKAEKAGLAIEWDRSGAEARWLLEGYLADKAAKNYDGPDAKIVAALMKSFAAGGNAHIGKAIVNSQPAAGVLILSHGASATYQIGWTTPHGRDCGAHHALLWDALRYLKGVGCQSFDLGGVNDRDAKGVQQFKEGLGGGASTLAGFYT